MKRKWRRLLNRRALALRWTKRSIWNALADFDEIGGLYSPNISIAERIDTLSAYLGRSRSHTIIPTFTLLPSALDMDPSVTHTRYWRDTMIVVFIVLWSCLPGPYNWLDGAQVYISILDSDLVGWTMWVDLKPVWLSYCFSWIVENFYTYCDPIVEILIKMKEWEILNEVRTILWKHVASAIC